MTFIPQFEVILITPTGYRLDISSRIEEIGLLTEAIEDDLLEMVHGDLDLELDDRDGEIEKLLGPAVRTDEYVVEVWRYRQQRRGAQKLWAGILDLPWSLSYDRKNQRARFQVFSYSKLLERASASTVARDIGTQVGTVSAGAAIVTLDPGTTLLDVGDKIKLIKDGASEEKEILSVDSTTQVTTTENFTNAFDEDTLVLTTPYYRNKTVEYLAGLLFEQAGITEYDLELDAELSAYPVTQPLNKSGLPPPSSELPKSIVEESSNISISYPTSDRKVSSDTTEAFTDGASDNDAQGDWRPYLDAEPGAILENTTVDTGANAWDHTTGERWSIRISFSIISGPSTIWLQKDGVDQVQLDTYSTGGGPYFHLYWLDYDPENHQVWISWSRLDGTLDRLEYYDITGASRTTIKAKYGRLRTVDSQNQMVFHNTTDEILEIYDVTSKQMTYSRDFVENLHVWTIRKLDTFILGLYRTSVGTSRMQVWNAADWTAVADYQVAEDNDGYNYLTVFTRPDGNDVGVGYSGGEYFVVSRILSGVVPYADFEDKSCAAAMRDLAILSGTIVTVNEDRIGKLYARIPALSASPKTVGTPIERETHPLYELYRSSVTVVGETEGGSEIEVIAGDVGDSANRLSLETKLITTEGLAIALAELYAGILSVERSEERIQIEELDELIRPFDQINLDNTVFVVLEVESDLEDAVQGLRLMEIT